jgi:hypothetical protein
VALLTDKLSHVYFTITVHVSKLENGLNLKAGLAGL